VHQYSHAFIDFRNFNDGHANYHQNSIKVTRKHRQMGVEGFWGFSAGDADGGYKVFDPKNNDGTFCIGCALGSAMFLPQEVISDAEAWMTGPHRERIWGRYGFVDGMNVQKRWYANTVLGITVGPLYMSLANTTGETMWSKFMQIPEIKRGLERAAASPRMIP